MPNADCTTVVRAVIVVSPGPPPMTPSSRVEHVLAPTVSSPLTETFSPATTAAVERTVIDGIRFGGEHLADLPADFVAVARRQRLHAPLAARTSNDRRVDGHAHVVVRRPFTR